MSSRIARLSTLKPWSAFRASDKADKQLLDQVRIWDWTLTLDAPVFLGITEKHDKLIGSESLEIGDRENLRKTFLERLDLFSNSLAKDSINDFFYIVINIVGSHNNVFSTRLDQEWTN